ncbi:MAG TPA: NAD(P)/FAD-dependent oxidoreductase [Gemmatimonadaceae bacterium]
MSSTKRRARKDRQSRSRKGTRVIVVGAGVAGLAAGKALAEAGVPFVILEARRRVGGRVWTTHPPSLTVPVELGAEFTHGEAEEVREIVDKEGLRLLDISGRRFRSTGDRVRVLDDFWERLDHVMRVLDEEREPDRSFAEAVAANRALSDEDRAIALQFVASFHAANPAIMSERVLAEGGSPRGEVRERRIGRIADGYDSILEILTRNVRRRIRLGTIVRSIRWSRGRVEVRTAGGRSVTGSAAIITVPLGVLAAPAGERGRIAFEPSLPPATRSAIDDLTMGTVSKITLQFDEPFWTTRRFASSIGDERLDTMSFLHGTSDVDYPIWWTTYPIRSPLLVGWCGGVKALALDELSATDRETAALRSLAKLLSMDPRTLRERLVGSHSHNWTADPFTRGAYSYARVGGADASKRLARPVEGTLYFAGEAADVEGGRTGTVHGAIATGRRAASLIIR